MILQGNITVNGKKYEKGSYISPWKIYPFFLIHMAGFGESGFAMAYFTNTPTSFLFIHGGFAVLIYLVFYVAIFGVDEVKWMFINSLLGIFGVYSEIRILLSWAGKDINSFPIYVHVIPFLYYILYMFLLRQIFIEVTGSRADNARSEKVSYIYLFVSLLIYIPIFIIGKG